MERPKKGRANSVEKIVLDKEHIVEDQHKAGSDLYMMGS
jgi:hypothetical protein